MFVSHLLWMALFFQQFTKLPNHAWLPRSPVAHKTTQDHKNKKQQHKRQSAHAKKNPSSQVCPVVGETTDLKNAHGPRRPIPMVWSFSVVVRASHWS